LIHQLTTFKESEINLPDGYSFVDVENLEGQYLSKNGEIIVLVKEKLHPIALFPMVSVQPILQ